MSQPQVVMLVVSVEQQPTAKTLAHTLLQEKLAACIHCLPQGTSFYHWQGQLEESTEHTLLIKTSAALAEKAMARIAALHPYDVPEILQFSATGGLPAYLNWVQEQTSAGLE